MNEEILSLIRVDRDAVATNRGFYYQYLNVALKWVTNYLSGNTSDVYTEVDDDIKEVGDQLVFTQLKCYASSLSFNSVEVKKAILNFYSLYLQQKEEHPDLEFCFTTNTRIAAREKLLLRWIDEQPPLGELESLCKSKIATILLKEIKVIRDNRLSKKKLLDDDKKYLVQNFNKLNTIVTDELSLSDFVGKIRWSFAEETPEASILTLTNRITEELCNPLFGERSSKRLFEAILSEIFRKSQLTEEQERKVTFAGMKILIEANDKELDKLVDSRLISLFNVRLDLLENSILDVKEIVTGVVDIQKQQGELIQKFINQCGNYRIPKHITTSPFFDDSNIIRRDDKISEINKHLQESSHVIVNGDGGMGKSTLLKSYLNQYESRFDHLLWLNAENGLLNSISLSQQVADALQLPIEHEQFSERFGHIHSRLKSIEGNNLIIIDSYNETAKELDDLRSLTNWKILIGTHMRLPGWKSINTDALSFDEAKTMFVAIDDQNQNSDEELKLLFEAVEYNTLTICLIAKTIVNSLDLSLAKVMEHLNAQDLEDVSLQIDLPAEDGTSVRLLNILKATFDLTKLDTYEHYFMLYFSLLPVQEVDIIDLVDWFGKRLEAKNKTEITNAINKLHTKGLVQRNRGQVSMHKMLQQTILYNERQTPNPFLTQSLLIGELTARINEGADHNISQALRFLKYGEAILENIKEPYRGSIYHPMLLLENEVLNIYNWLYTENDLSERYRDLYERAKKYLGVGASLTGVIANNYGLALVAEGDLDSALPLFDQSSVILAANGDHALPQLLTSLCNLCHLFIKRGEMQKFSDCFGKMREYRDKYNLWDDVSLPIQANIMGIANKTHGNVKKAQEMFNMAINLHLELAQEKRNDLQLVGYVLHATECYLMTQQIEKAEKAVIFATNILSKINAKDTIFLGEVIKYLIVICEIKGDKDQADKLKQTLRNMGFKEGEEEK